MAKCIEYAQHYPLVLLLLAGLFLLACWRSEEVRAWVLRLIVLLLVLALLFFVYKKYSYLLPSSHQAPAFRDDRLLPEEHVGKKYYQDPAERLRER
jgi:hypothetical protein